MLFHILSVLYLLALVALGWRLVRIGWPVWIRLGSAIVLVLLTPALFLIPAVRRPDGPFSDLLLATGIGMVAAGLIATLLGAAIALLWRRRTR